MTSGNEAERPSTREVAQRGITLVREEVERRGGFATPDTTPGARNRLVLRPPRGQRLSLYVKTRRRGDWQTDIRKGHHRETDPNETSFWVFVDLLENSPAFYVVPEWWIENDIYVVHRDYLARHGGRRAQNPLATHHRITTDRVLEWRDRWDLVALD